MTAAKWVYSFGDGKAEGRAGDRNLLGGKGANLAEMSNLSLPVPPGFTLTTEVCTYFYANEQSYPADLKDEVAGCVGGSREKHRRTVRRLAKIRCWCRCVPVLALPCRG